MRAYERFVKYIAIDTQSSETSGTHPSTTSQFDLARLLVDELKDLGISASVDDRCYVMAHLPATPGYEDKPTLGLISHMDSAPAYSGAGIKPIFHEDYDGGDVKYPCGKVMKADDFPFLKELSGETLITSDGTTLLAADDKAGVAEIMTALSVVISEGRPHGPIAVAFTPDEEIGEGADNFDVKAFAADFAYTVDGGDVGQIEYENFNAADAKIEITGVSVHPGSAKDVMINALNVAHELHGMLPEEARPEHTEGYEGFFHLVGVSGDVAHTQLHYIIRDHDMKKFEDKKQLMEKCVGRINERYGDGTAVLTLTDSYYNMREKIEAHMHLVRTAEKAIKAVGLTSTAIPIRGGTDGARLSFMGLPCPNLGTGGFNFHGPFECITVERMDRAVAVIVNIIEEYAHSVIQ